MTPARLDLHVHSTASDGVLPPAEVPARAHAAGLGVIALTDHDSVAGVDPARAAGASLGVRVIAGCEFSVEGPGGEMHLLGYFLPLGEPALDAFLQDQRDHRRARGAAIVGRLNRLGVALTMDDVGQAAGTGAVGRPHVARALVARGAARDVNDAFDRYLGAGRPAYVAKDLPPVGTVTRLVRSLGGLTCAAHLKDRATRTVLTQLQEAGVDGVEARHPSHDPAWSHRIETLAAELGLLLSGGSDWHGDFAVDRPLAALGAIDVPAAWLTALEWAHAQRSHAEVAK